LIPVKETVVRSSRLVTYSKGEKEMKYAINIDKEEGGGKSHEEANKLLSEMTR
jgi:hypothetical protein